MDDLIKGYHPKTLHSAEAVKIMSYGLQVFSKIRRSSLSRGRAIEKHASATLMEAMVEAMQDADGVSLDALTHASDADPSDVVDMLKNLILLGKVKCSTPALVRIPPYSFLPVHD